MQWQFSGRSRGVSLGSDEPPLALVKELIGTEYLLATVRNTNSCYSTIILLRAELILGHKFLKTLN